MLSSLLSPSSIFNKYWMPAYDCEAVWMCKRKKKNKYHSFMTFKSTPLHLKLRLSKSMMNVVATKMTRIFCCTVTYIDAFNLQNGTRNFPTPHGEGKKTLPDINSRLHKSDLCIYGKPPVLLLKAWFWPTWGNTYISPRISSLHIEQRSACLPNCPILHVDTSLLWWKLNLLLQSQTVFSGRGCTVHDQRLCMKWGK